MTSKNIPQGSDVRITVSGGDHALPIDDLQRRLRDAGCQINGVFVEHGQSRRGVSDPDHRRQRERRGTSHMNGLTTIFKRELRAYFATPVAYVFIVIFLVLAGVATFYMGGFYERGQADLEPFFQFHPWLYMFLIPAISMRLWSEERKAGTLELLLTLPVPLSAAVIGKFLAAWAFTAVALLGTAPLWLTVNYLGEPDNTVILAGYLGSLLMAGGFLAIGACISALTKNQVIAFVVSFVICFAFNLSGFRWSSTCSAPGRRRRSSM